MADAPLSDKAKASVLKQVEFYFSNSNLPSDKFLRGLVESNEEGWVSIETIASFKRMRDISENVAGVTETLKTSKVLDVSEDGKNIKRKEPFRSDYWETAITQSIYAKGFNVETSTLESIQDFLTPHLGEAEKILCVRMRRERRTKAFKGSVFVELNSPAAAERFAALTIPRAEKGSEGEENMLLYTKKFYIEMKKGEKEKERAERKAKKGKKRKLDGDNAGGAEDVAETPKENYESKEYEKDCIIHFDQLSATCSREDLKGLVEAGGGVTGYIDYSRGEVLGYVRLKEDSAIKAAAMAAKLTGEKKEVEGKVPVIRALEGEEEQKYWFKIWELLATKSKGKKKFNKGGRGKRHKC